MRGFTLIELMIALTLGLVVLSGVGWVYLGTMRTYRVHDALSRMQEGARHAFELIGRDLRMTGATGCAHDTSQNALNGNTDWSRNLFRQPLISFEKDGSVGVTEHSDALAVLHADLTREYIVQIHDAGSAQFTLTGPHDLTDGEFLLATDCSHAAVFQASSASGSTVMHTAGGTPGNSTANLGASGLAYTFTPGARLYRLSVATYYIANNGAGVPALFRLKPRGATATPTPEELVEGVEDLQIAYGVDTSVPANGQADFVDPDADGDPYLTAEQVESAAVPGANAEERWARVVSVRVSLLMRTVEDRITSSAQQYTYAGTTVSASDLRMRKVFTHVVKLRNR
jgi:type IV pilus assembly protein PilW